MEKKLPKVYTNILDKKFENNETVYYDRSSNKEEVKKDNNIISKEYSINQKINKIFGSSRYVYKLDVIITTKDGKTAKKIIARNKNELITMDNEIIKIVDIIDIDFNE